VCRGVISYNGFQKGNARYDVSSPLDIAWQLSKRWKTSRLVVIGDAGHGVSDSFLAAITEALSGVS
jgi:proline iminopeptidase